MSDNRVRRDEIVQRKRRSVNRTLRKVLDGTSYTFMAECMPTCARAPRIGERHAFEVVSVFQTSIPGSRGLPAYAANLSDEVSATAESTNFIVRTHQVHIGDVHIVERCHVIHFATLLSSNHRQVSRSKILRTQNALMLNCSRSSKPSYGYYRGA